MLHHNAEKYLSMVMAGIAWRSLSSEDFDWRANVYETEITDCGR